MQEYTLIYAEPYEDKDKIPLILKDRPAHLKGRFNYPGGKVDPGEDHFTAAKRELLEETGLESDCWTYGGKIVCDGILHHYKAKVYLTQPLLPREGETEVVNWYNWSDIIKDKRLMPNIRMTLPLMRAGIYGWEISDLISSRHKTIHELGIKLAIPMFCAPA